MEKIMSGFSQLVVILIGIPPLIFVICVSFLGRSIKMAKEKVAKDREKHEGELTRKRDIAKQKHQEVVDKQNNTKIPEAKKALDDIEKELERFSEETKKTTQKYAYLNLKESFLIPSGCFLLAFIVITISRPYIETNSHNLLSNGVVTTSIASIIVSSILFIMAGILQTYRVLQVIEEVARPAEEAFTASLKQVLVEVEEAKKPILRLNFKDTPPFNIRKSSKFDIKFAVYLTRGDTAKTVQVMFFAPSGFDYPSAKNKWSQNSRFTMPNALSTTVNWPIILRRINQLESIKVKVPDTPGKYTLGYSLSCEGFVSEIEKFDVIVEDQLPLGKLSDLLKDKPIRET